MDNLQVSVIVPVYNEEKSILELFARIKTALANHSYEVLVIDDGSTDGTRAQIESAAKKDNNIKAVFLRRNLGQTTAIQAGIDFAGGDIIVPIDADLENDPADIPQILDKINDGFDIVSGWRKNRWKGQLFTRKIPSLFANGLISRITGVRLHDYGCTLKAYRCEYLKSIRLYGEMHRFIPAYAVWHGARIAEIEVSHTPRKHGASNYGFSRTFKVILDLLVFRFLDRYMTKPIHFFGGLGIVSFVLGVAVGISALVLKLLEIRDLVSTPLPILASLLIIIGVQLILMGILAEMIMRSYFESSVDKKTYAVMKKVNI